MIVDPRLKERDAGEFSGLTRADIDAQFPGMLDRGEWPPGWEDDEAVLVRVLAALDDILTTTGGHGDVLAVSHGGIIYTLEGHFGLAHERIANLGGSLASPRRICVATRRAPAARPRRRHHRQPGHRLMSSADAHRHDPTHPVHARRRSSSRYPVEVIRSDKRNKTVSARIVDG